MRVTLDIWRQDGPKAKGRFERHVVEDAEPEWSILELLDRLNDQIVENPSARRPSRSSVTWPSIARAWTAWCRPAEPSTS